MDTRLQLVNGKMLTHLRREDLPQVALAISGAIRGHVRAARQYVGNLAYYTFLGTGVNVSIMATDYEKILPYLEDGSFDKRPFGESLYQSVLSVLQVEFKDSYPTSHF